MRIPPQCAGRPRHAHPLQESVHLKASASLVKLQHLRALQYGHLQ
ncbi:MAG: hypothetical protein AAGF23_15520 [Acidobacteriota bacterium]